MNEPSELLKRLLEASADSPLGEADAMSFDELMTRVQKIFNKRPLEHTDEEVYHAMLYYRHQRAKFAVLAKEKELSDSEKPKRGTKTLRSSDDVEL